MVLAKDTHTSIPAWVKFFDVPLEYWSSLGLSELASSLGKPIHVDTMTKDHKRLGFTRICIEVHVSSFFPPYVKLYQGLDEVIGETKIARVLVEYQPIRIVKYLVIKLIHVPIRLRLPFLS